jgi:hypothetical protein
VVGVRVAAVLVVRRHDVRALATHHLDERAGGLLEVAQAEAALGQRRQRVALGQPESTKPRKTWRRRGCPRVLHLLRPDGGDVREDLGAVHGRVEHRPARAVGERHDEHVDALAA